MINSGPRQTAKIYAFRPRSTGNERDRDVSRFSADVRPLRIETVACTESWYHEAALQDADRFRKQ